MTEVSAKAVGWKPQHCIFCGKRPKSKTKEHFIPRWLSRDSGNDHIPAEFETPAGRTDLKFSSISAPACQGCNSKMAALETKTKLIFQSIHEGSLPVASCNDLLDWLDKFRISNWLYMLSIRKKSHNIEPRFTINEGIGRFDRVMSISLLPDAKSKGIGIVGHNTNFFISTPSIIGLLFRDIALLSWSDISCVGDYFGLTQTDDCKNQDDHPCFLKAQGTNAAIPNGFDINRLPSIEVFSFAEETSKLHAQYTSGVPMILDGTGEIQELSENLKIPKSSSNKWIARDLFTLSTLELQKRMSTVSSILDVSEAARLANLVTQNQLDKFIDTVLARINRNSLFQYTRKVPKIVL